MIASAQDLIEMLQQVNASCGTASRPAVFDFGNRKLSCPPCPRTKRQLFITANNVTLRNLSIMLGNQDDNRFELVAECRNLRLENVIINGGDTSLNVRQRSSVVLHDCLVQDAKWGIIVGSESDKQRSKSAAAGSSTTMFACKVEITNFSQMGLYIYQGADVQLENCVVSGCKPVNRNRNSIAVFVKGKVTARHLICQDNPGMGFLCNDQGVAVLECCKFMSGPNTTVEVGAFGPECYVALWYCTLSQAPIALDGCAISDMKLVSQIFE